MKSYPLHCLFILSLNFPQIPSASNFEIFGVREKQRHEKTIKNLYINSQNQNIADTISSEENDVSKYVWDLSPLYENEIAWKDAKKEIEDKIKTIGDLKGILNNNAQSLADVMDAVYDLRAKAARMAIYGILLHEVDNGIS